MLDYAIKHVPELNNSFLKIYGDEQYKYWNYGVYWDSKTIKDSTWESIQMVSINNNKLLGYLEATINRSHNNITALSMLNFDLTKISITFVQDMNRFVNKLFNMGFSKISFSVVVGNPAERLYDKFIETCGGRVVGTKYKDIKLTDGKVYDTKFYEILKEDYYGVKE